MWSEQKEEKDNSYSIVEKLRRQKIKERLEYL